MPATGTPIIPRGTDVWTFNDATSVLVGGTKLGWTTTGVTAAALPGACVSPLTSKTAVGVEFVFADDSRLYQQAGSIELCGSYSATKPPIVLSGSTGAGAPAVQTATLRPSALTSTTVPNNTPRYTTSVSAIASETDGVGPTLDNLPGNYVATLRAGSFSGLTALPARTVLESATVTLRHRDRSIAAGGTLQVIVTPNRGGAAPITRDIPLTYASTTSPFEIDEADLLAELKPRCMRTARRASVSRSSSTRRQHAAGRPGDRLRQDQPRLASDLHPSAGRLRDRRRWLRRDARIVGRRAQQRLYVQGTVYVPKAKVTVALRVADGPIFADGVIARAFVLQSDAFSGGSVYDGSLIQIPDLRAEATPLLVYLTAWTCTSSTPALSRRHPPPGAGGRSSAGRWCSTSICPPAPRPANETCRSRLGRWPDDIPCSRHGRRCSHRARPSRNPRASAA